MINNILIYYVSFLKYYKPGGCDKQLPGFMSILFKVVVPIFPRLILCLRFLCGDKVEAALGISIVSYFGGFFKLAVTVTLIAAVARAMY